MHLLLFIAISALVGGGASVAAEGSLPGDVLYPIKVNVNERVRGFIALSEEAKADLNSNLAVRRLDEVERLAVRGDLSADVRTRLESNFEAFADRVETRIKDLEDAGKINAALDVGSRFESSLSAHERILAEINVSRPAISSILGKVRTEINNSANARARVESKIGASASADVQAAAEGRLKAAENKITEARAYIEAKKVEISAEAYAEAQARLNSAESRIASGKISFEAGVYADAFLSFQAAHRQAQEAKLAVQVRSGLLKIEVSNNTSENTNNGEANVNANTEINVNSSGDVNVEGEVEVEIGL
ncbi:MAG TPA: DUF5667 domain-containing protein [Candidatus Paceibacterota bacterium]